MVYDKFKNFNYQNVREFKEFDKYKCKYKIDECADLVSKKIEFNIDDDDFRKDIVLDDYKYTRIFGKVYDTNNKCCEGIIVTLYKFEVINYKTDYTAIGETITDETGFFQFIIEQSNLNYNYKIKVSENI